MFAGALGASNCPGAPRLDFFLGRKDATKPAPDGLVPEPFDLLDDIFARLKDASNGEFDEILTVWLLTAHTIAAAPAIEEPWPNLAIQAFVAASTTGTASTAAAPAVVHTEAQSVDPGA